MRIGGNNEVNKKHLCILKIANPICWPSVKTQPLSRFVGFHHYRTIVKRVKGLVLKLTTSYPYTHTCTNTPCSTRSVLGSTWWEIRFVCEPLYVRLAGHTTSVLELWFWFEDPRSLFSKKSVNNSSQPLHGSSPLASLVGFNPLCRIKGTSNLSAAAQWGGWGMLPAAHQHC